MSKILTARSLAALAALAIFAAAPRPAAAQVVVGHTPETSPFHDITSSQRITLFGGYFHGQGDPLGTSPQSGPSVGLRYDLPVSGPADFYVRTQHVSSHRYAYDPTLPTGTRALGRQSLSLVSAELGFALNLTGRRTWHGFIPALGFGLGIVSAPGTTGKDPYTFGTQFEFSGTVGVRFNPSNSYELRVDAGPMFYQNHYPLAYFNAPAGSTPLLATTTSRNGYQRSMNYTAGLSIPVFR